MKKALSKKQRIVVISCAAILLVAVVLLVVLLTQHRHDFGDWETTKEPTCSEAGEMIRYCNCGWSEKKSIETLNHSFTIVNEWTENDKHFVRTTCEVCLMESDIISEGIFLNESEELYLNKCPVDFYFDVICDKGIDYVKSNVFVADSFFKELDLSQYPELVHETNVTSLGKDTYRIAPSSNYGAMETYAIRCSDDIKMKDYHCKSLSFTTLGEREAFVDYNKNIVFLEAMENASAGYYPYALVFDSEANKHTLTLSKQGDFVNEDLIGKILCVGDCASIEELSESGRDYTFGKIESVSVVDGKTLVTLGEPAIEEIYNDFFLTFDAESDLENAIDVEEYEQVLVAEVMRSDGFVQMLTASNIAAKNFANDNGIALAANEPFNPKNIKLKTNSIGTKTNQNGDLYAELDFLLTYTCTNPISRGETEGDITFSFELNPTIKFTFEKVAAKLVKVTQLKVDVAILQEASLTFDMDIKLNLQDTDPVMEYIVSKSGKIHKYTCTTCSELRKDRNNYYTFEQIKDQFPYYLEVSCQLCKPFTMDNSCFIYNVDSNVLHCANCVHANNITSAEVEIYENYPWGNTYSNCETCKPQQNQKDVEAYLKESIKDSAWDVVFEKLKEEINGAFDDKKIVNAGATAFKDSKPVATVYLEILEIPIYAAPSFVFDLDATLDFHYETSSAVRYVVANSVEENKNEKKAKNKITVRQEIVGDDRNYTDWMLDVKGQVNVRLGVMSEVRLSFSGLSDYLYVGLFGEVGAYSRLNGVLHLEKIGSNYYAAYLEAGIYFDARLVYRIPIILPEGSVRFFGDDIKEIPLFDAGDSKAYYAFNNDDAQLLLNKNSSMALPDSLLSVSYFDLKQMKCVTGSNLSWKGNKQYSISCAFYDESGAKVDYCSVENGMLKLTDSAPENFTVKMLVSVEDLITYSSLGDYLKSNDGNAFYMDTLTVTVKYSKNAADSAILKPSEGLEFVWCEYDDDVSGWYVVRGTCTSKNLVIPSTYAGKPVVAIGEASFAGCDFIESVVIPDSIKVIHDVAFIECTSLKEVTIPDSVNELVGDVFYGCTSLTSVKIGKNVSYISGGVFSGCTKLTSVSVDKGNTTYYSQNNAIIEKATKTLVVGWGSNTIPEDVIAIGNSAFSGSNITSIKIPKNVKTIDAYAFYNCTNLTDITVDQNNKSYSSFDGVVYNKNKTELVIIPSEKKTITIPDSLTTIEFYRFDSCKSLTDIVIGTNNPNYTSVGGVVYNKDCTELIYCPKGKNSVSIQNSVKTIGEGAFSGCDKLTSVTIPDSVETIGENAFMYCDNLTKVTFGTGLRRIDGYAFYSCKKLSTISFPDNITSIGRSAFARCESLKEIKLGKGLTALSVGVFEYCKGLTTVTIQEGVQTISIWAFLGCENLKTVNLPASIDVIGGRSFAFCPSLKTINYNGTKSQWESVTKISEWDIESGAYTVKCTNGTISK